ncbi:neprilysin-4-like isoform X2 [Photinus pyralis]|uniref:neprilysin-4-like isoform X2 n=1 Tax=Photinus pyralis TaxID=7054 RepID=UPI001266F7AF|nr:neprilysin-4-like isoform X2 [Photinus pyralis]
MKLLITRTHSRKGGIQTYGGLILGLSQLSQSYNFLTYVRISIRMKYKVSISGLPKSVDSFSNGQLGNSRRRVDNSIKFAILIFLSTSLLLISSGTIVLLGFRLTLENDHLCVTTHCVNTASRILRTMDKTVDPCKDFYQYACGGWIRSNPVPDWTATWDRLAELREMLIQQMRQLLEVGDGSLNKTSQSSGVRKARIMYRTCMDADKVQQSLEPLEKILRAMGLPEHPSLFKHTDFDWLFTIAKARRLLGVSLLYGFNVADDVRNSSKNKIVIEQTAPGFGERYLLRPEKFSNEIEHYKLHIQAMLKEYTTTFDDSFADNVISFSKEVAKMNWTRYLDVVFQDTNVVLLPHNDTVILFDLPYMEKVARLIKNTSPNILLNFLWWSVFSRLAPTISEKYSALNFQFTQKILGVQMRAPKWKTCVTSVNAHFGLALSYLYVRSQPDRSYIQKVLQMLRNIKHAFEGSLDQSNWMDVETRKKMLLKLQAIRSFVGYPGWIINSTQLDHYYSKVHVIDGNLFETNLNLMDASVRRNLENIRKGSNRNRWVATATTVNAFYSATLNSVTFPAGILKPPFYGNGIAAIDYGSIGAIMGHEITHGFDDQGRRYDEHGNLNQWWSLTTMQHYHNKVKCIIEQYSNYSMPELGPTFPVQGYNTQGENVADNGGLHAAYEGFRRYRARANFYPQKLPGLSDLNMEQLFFLGFAQIWCGNSTTEALKVKLLNGAHSPNRIRVLGALQNSEEFANAWNCPGDSPMNPRKKCTLW